MKNNLLSALCFLVANVNILASQTTIDLTTGKQNGTTNLLTTGANDDTWMVKVPGSTSFVSIKCMDGFLDSSPVSQWPQVSGAKWISPSINSSNQAEKVAMGSYQYRMIFNTNCGSISSAVMTLEKMGADNMVNKIQLNGTDIGF